METKCFAHVDSLRSGISRPYQKLCFLSPSQPRSSGTQVDPKRSDLFEQMSPDREACTEWWLLSIREYSGLGAMIEPNERSID
jgi:hypothetical protein